jgi:hypothetical protein
MRGLGRYGWDYFLSGIEVFRSDEGLVAQERGPRAAVHGLDEATRLSRGMSASPQSPFPLRPARPFVAQPHPAVSTSGSPVIQT